MKPITIASLKALIEAHPERSAWKMQKILKDTPATRPVQNLFARIEEAIRKKQGLAKSLEPKKAGVHDRIAALARKLNIPFEEAASKMGRSGAKTKARMKEMLEAEARETTDRRTAAFNREYRKTRPKSPIRHVHEWHSEDMAKMVKEESHDIVGSIHKRAQGPSSPEYDALGVQDSALPGIAPYSAGAGAATLGIGAGNYNEEMEGLFRKWNQSDARVGDKLSRYARAAGIRGDVTADADIVRLSEAMPDRALSNMIHDYELHGRRALKPKMLGAIPVARLVAGAYHHTPLMRPRQYAYDVVDAPGLGNRIMEAVTAPLRMMTTKPTDAERELLKQTVDHYDTFAEGTHPDIFQHWLHRSQRETGRPIMEHLRQRLAHGDVHGSLPPAAKAVLGDPTTTSKNVLARLEATGLEGAWIKRFVKYMMTDLALTTRGPRALGYIPASEQYHAASRPIRNIFRAARPLGIAGAVALPALYMLNYMNNKEKLAPKTAQAAVPGERPPRWWETDRAKDIAAGGAGLTGAGLLGNKVWGTRLHDYIPNADVAVGLAPWDVISNEKLYSDAPAQLNSMETQARSTLHGMRNAGGDIKMTNMRSGGGPLNNIAPGEAVNRLHDVDAVIQFGDQNVLNDPSVRRYMHRRDMPRAWHMSDFGAGGTFHQRPGTLVGDVATAPMYIRNPRQFDHFITPGGEALKDLTATQYMNEFGMMRDINLNGKVLNLNNMPAMDVFQKGRFNASPTGPVRALFTVGGGSGRQLPFVNELLNADGLLKKDPAVFLTKRNVLDDIADSMRSKYGDNFTVDVLHSSGGAPTGELHKNVQDIYALMKAEKARGNPRFANMNFIDSIPQRKMADLVGRSHYIFGLPGSTMGEIMSMSGKAPKVVGIVPAFHTHPDASGHHWEGNVEYMKRMFPGFTSVNAGETPENRLAQMMKAVNEGYEGLGHHKGVHADYAPVLESIVSKVRMNRWKNLGKVGLLGAAVAAPAAYLLGKHWKSKPPKMPVSEGGRHNMSDLSQMIADMFAGRSR